MRLTVCLSEPVCAATLRPRTRCDYASVSRPITVAKRGLRTTSANEPS